MKAVGLSAAKYKVLSQIAKSKEPVPLRLLAEEQQCVASNVTTLVDRLEADGLVRRVDDPADRRSKRATLTSLGEEKAEDGAQGRRGGRGGVRGVARSDGAIGVGQGAELVAVGVFFCGNASDMKLTVMQVPQTNRTAIR